MKIKKKPFLAFMLSAAFACLVAILPWSDMRSSPYYDRENYIYFIDQVPNKLEWFDYDGILVKLMNEWGWQKFLQIMTVDFQLTSTPILFIVTFFSLFIASMFLSRRFYFLSFLFLLNPIFIDFVVSQLRLAFAMSFLFVALWLYGRRNILYIPILISLPFIHTSSVLFIFIVGTALLLGKIQKIPARTKAFFAITSGAIVSIVTGPLMSAILSSLEDRRAEYSDMSSPLLYSSFWIILYLYFSLKGFSESSNKSFNFYISLAVLTMIPFGAIFGGYPMRFVAACFPFIIAAMLENQGKESRIIIIAYVLFSLLLWGFWFT